MFDGEDALGQISTHVARQSAQPEARHPPRRTLPGRGRGGRRRDERLGRRLPRPAHRRRLAAAARLHDEHLPPARPAPGRSPPPPCRRLGLLRLDRRRRPLRRQQSRADARRRARRSSSTCRRSRRPKKPRSGTTSSRRSSRTWPAARHDQDLRARRTDRGVLPADGDSRRAAIAVRRLQHRPLGLHQQRLRRGGLGSRLRQSEHRRHHDDLRLHAALRGPRAPRRQHAGSARPNGAVAGRHGAEHPGRLRGRRRREHGARGCRRRARAARGRQRQVGRALEDGPHRPAGLGEGGRGQPARTEVPRADLHGRRRRAADRARAGAAHGSRRARSDQRRACSTATPSVRACRPRR